MQSEVAAATEGFIMQAACRRLLFYDRAPLEMKHLDHNSGFDWGQRDTNHTEAFTNEVPAEKSEIISLIFGLSSQSSVMFPLFAVAHKSCFSSFCSASKS